VLAENQYPAGCPAEVGQQTNHNLQRTKVMKVYVYCLVAALLGATVAWGQGRDAPQGRTEAEAGVEVLTRGPVHEAFAGTVTYNPQPGILIPSVPPDAIEELPPEQRPAGENVAWIPGYWAWDDERSDFLWISGIWRNLPPGRQWVPGYWGQAGQNYQWTSGYWADATASEIEYLPQPPASVEVGPNIAASSADQTWLPGCWVWHQSRYAWRPGYWATVQPNWVWTPAYYAWAPRGYVFVDGYWDYSVARRGILFAPVYFNSSVYSRPGYFYSPNTVINPAVFISQLFLRPNYQHYYFGDYYAASYSSAGYYPWYSYNSSRYGYDPIYAHQSWQHRQDRSWQQQVQADFQHRRDHEEARPPRTWAAQNALVASQANSTEKSFVIAAPLAQLVKSTDSPLRFQPVAQEERQRLAEHGQAIQKFRQERQKLEVNAAVSSGADPSRQPEPAKVKFSRSPIVARSAEQFDRDQAPPKRFDAPQPDPRVQPVPNQSGRPELPAVTRPDTNRPDTNRPALPRTDVNRPETTRPGIAPLPGLNRPSEQPRPPTNLPRLDTERPLPTAPPRGDSPNAGRDPPGLEVPRPAPQPQPQPKVERPAPQPQPQPKVERPAPQPQPQPKVERPAPQPQPQPKVERPAPQPRPQPKVERPAPQKPPKQDNPKGVGNGKGKDKN
jgi:hypothetical protein